MGNSPISIHENQDILTCLGDYEGASPIEICPYTDENADKKHNHFSDEIAMDIVTDLYQDYVGNDGLYEDDPPENVDDMSFEYIFT